MSGAHSYRCILVDPPWSERGAGKIKRGADRHYPLMKSADIAELPVGHVADPTGCHLWLWATNNYLPHALEVMSNWGFRYLTNMAWAKVKTLKSGEERLQMGIGQYLRGSHELLLLGVRGKQPALHKDNKDVPTAKSVVMTEEPVVFPPEQGWEGTVINESLILAPRQEHSAKPDVVYDMVERVSPGPRLELFARQEREGWDAVGHETGWDARTWLLCWGAHLAANAGEAADESV